MNCRVKFRRRASAERQAEAGYMLLTLMLLAALVAIALAAVVPKLSQQIRRDEEEELIHRGVQYSRAIRKFYKKFGHHPVRLEELDNSNNIRFLRKHYKDPITGKDFKLLHFGEVQMGFGPGIVGAVPPAGQSGIAGGQNSINVQAGPTTGPTPSRGQDSSNPTADQSQSSSSPSSSLLSSSNSSASPDAAGSNSSPGATVVPASQAAGSPLVVGGSAIVGVVSTSKKQSIREFNKKDHYDQWQFIYDPSTDRGGLLNSPAQPVLQGAGQTQVAGPGQSANPPGVPTLGGPAGQGSSPQPPPQMPPNQPPQ